jgi:hypothetical protein
VLIIAEKGRVRGRTREDADVVRDKKLLKRDHEEQTKIDDVEYL